MNNPIITASGAIPAYACVKVSTSGSERVEVATSAADVVFAVTLAANTASGAAVNFQTTDSQLDIFTLKAAGTIGIGQYVVPTTNGTVAAATTGPFVALEAATIGQTFTARKFNAGATANFLAPGTGTITRTLDSKLSDVISVKDYGATGDGTTNDTTFIQAALDANAGKSVYFPLGTYRTTSRLIVAANTTLIGDDRKAVIDVQPAHAPIPNGSSGAAALTFNNGFELGGNGITFDGLWIKGTNEAKYRVGDLTKRDEYASGIRGSNKHDVVIKNCTFQEFGNGVFFVGGNNYKIIDNYFFGGRQMGAANQIANTHDIWMNGSSPAGGPSKGLRGIISRNHCFGNSDSAIAVAIESGDADVIISENICEPFQVDGVSAVVNLAPADPAVDVPLSDPVLNDPTLNKTRYSIVVSYVSGGLKSRIVVSNNIIRNYSLMGIYANASVESPLLEGSEVVIIGNTVTNGGGNLLYPSATSLKAGIWVNCNGGKTVSGNLIADHASCGIQINGAAGDPSNVFATPVITGNTILRTIRDPLVTNPATTSGSGIAIFGTTVYNVLVTSNRIFNSAGNAIQADGTSTAAGNLRIDSNLISHNNLLGAILITITAGGKDCFVSNNSITGTDAVEPNAGRNAGIWFNGRVHCTGNIITTFNRGIQSTITARTTDLICANNSMKNMVFGVCGNDVLGPWLVSNNTFTNISNNACHAAPYQGMMVRESMTSTGTKADIIQVTGTAPPTTGTWVRGDYVKNSNPSLTNPKGWYCTANGTPGTWVSEGAL